MKEIIHHADGEEFWKKKSDQGGIERNVAFVEACGVARRNQTKVGLKDETKLPDGTVMTLKKSDQGGIESGLRQEVLGRSELKKSDQGGIERRGAYIVSGATFFEEIRPRWD